MERTFKQELVELLPRLWRFGLSLSGSPEVSQDLVQATCERALSRYHQWRPGTRLDSWTFAIMHSIWKNELRAKSIRRGAGFVDAEQYLVADTPDSETLAEVEQVYQAVVALPEAQRAALILVYVEGYQYQEAAHILDIPMGTLMSRLARARLRVAQTLGESNASRYALSKTD